MACNNPSGKLTFVLAVRSLCVATAMRSPLAGTSIGAVAMKAADTRRNLLGLDCVSLGMGPSSA